MLASALATDGRGSRSDAVLRRFSGPTRRPAFWIGLWTIAAAVELAALASILVADEPVPGYRAFFRLVGGVFVACGLIGWHRRPDSYSGPLMIAMGVGLLVEPVFALFESPTIRLFGDLFEDAWGIADAFVSLFALLTLFACLGTAVVIGARWKRASPPRRRAMLPSVAGISCLLFFAAANGAGSVPLAWLAVCSLLVIPAAFLAGLLRSRLARGGLTDLLGELRTLRGAELQARLAKVTGDPSLVVAYRQPDGTYDDTDGAAVELEGRSVVRSPARRWSTTRRSTRTRR
jgi:hypothetical protein